MTSCHINLLVLAGGYAPNKQQTDIATSVDAFEGHTIGYMSWRNILIRDKTNARFKMSSAWESILVDSPRRPVPSLIDWSPFQAPLTGTILVPHNYGRHIYYSCWRLAKTSLPHKFTVNNVTLTPCSSAMLTWTLWLLLTAVLVTVWLKMRPRQITWPHFQKFLVRKLRVVNMIESDEDIFFIKISMIMFTKV